MNERRTYCRVSGAMVSDTTVRVRPGLDAALMNLCARGALIELRRPMAPGIHADLQFSRGEGRIAVGALVLRCSVRAVTALDGVTYQAALLFDEPCVFERATTARDGYLVPDRSDAIPIGHGSNLPATEDLLSASFAEPSK